MLRKDIWLSVKNVLLTTLKELPSICSYLTNWYQKTQVVTTSTHYNKEFQKKQELVVWLLPVLDYNNTVKINTLLTEANNRLQVMSSVSKPNGSLTFFIDEFLLKLGKHASLLHCSALEGRY